MPDSAFDVNRSRVYIAGPITKGNQAHNVATAAEVFKELIRLGMAPLCPQLSWYAEKLHDCVYDISYWMAVDLPWVAVSDALLRLPGDSVGADIEVQYARKLDKPVFYDVQSLAEWDEVQSVQS